MARFKQQDGRVHGVVAGVRREDGRWLCIRRAATVAAPLKVAFPGGGIDADESQIEALIREMREELGLVVSPVACVWEWQSPSTPLTLWGWFATADLRHPIHPDPTEVAEVLWLTGEQAANHPDAMPTCRAFVTALDSYRTRTDPAVKP